MSPLLNMTETTGFPATNPLSTIHKLSPTIWLLELHNGFDNRLTDTFIHSSLVPALDQVEKEWRQSREIALQTKSKEGTAGALIISGKLDQEKFFSNGLDYANSIKQPYFWPATFNPLLKKLLLFPIPTIAVINGHAFAAGWTLALICDYRVMIDGSKRNAWACMNEIHFGAPWPPPLAAIFRAKGASPSVIRQIALEGARFTPSELLKIGMVEALGNSTQELIAKAKTIGDKLSANASGGVWGLIKKNLYSDIIKALNSDLRTVMPAELDELAKAKL